MLFFVCIVTKTFRLLCRAGTPHFRAPRDLGLGHMGLNGEDTRFESCHITFSLLSSFFHLSWDRPKKNFRKTNFQTCKSTH